MLLQCFPASVVKTNSFLRLLTPIVAEQTTERPACKYCPCDYCSFKVIHGHTCTSLLITVNCTFVFSCCVVPLPLSLQNGK